MDTKDLQKKLKHLRKADSTSLIFGSATHRYELKPVATEKDVAAFEARFAVKLPPAYRDFILTVGNGGAGPGNGVLGLSQCLPHSFATMGEGCLSAPFLHKRQVASAALDPAIYDAGAIRVADQGQGSFDLLLVTGEHRGLLWYDGLASADALIPCHYDFAEWYATWLDNALQRFPMATGFWGLFSR